MVQDVFPWRRLKRRANLNIAAVLCVVLFLALAGSRGAPPKIDHIEIRPHLPQYILLHFDTEPNRTYVLEYTENLPGPTSTWATLWAPETSPQMQHYIYPDLRVAQQRFYRLRATP